MLTEFYFDGELFQDQNFKLKIMNDHLIKHWSEYGCLVVCKKDRGRSLFNDVEAKYKAKWQSYFTLSRKSFVSLNAVVSTFNDFDAVECAVKSYGVDSVFIAEGLHDDILGEKTQRCNDCNDFEVLIPDDIYNSSNFKKSEEYSKKDIEQGELVRDIWATRFDKLVAHTKVITILDRYFVKNLVEDIKENKKTSLETFLENLSGSSSRKISLHFYSKWDGNASERNSVEKYLSKSLYETTFFNDSIASVSISGCPDRFFSKNAHERFFKLDNHVLAIGNGMELFRTTQVKVTHFSSKHSSLTSFDKSLAVISRNSKWTLKSEKKS